MSVIAETISLAEVVKKSQFIVVARYLKDSNPDIYEVLEILKDSKIEGLPALQVKKQIVVHGANEELYASLAEQYKKSKAMPMPVVDFYKPSVEKEGSSVLVFLTSNAKKQFRYVVENSWESIAEMKKVLEESR